MLSYEQQGDMWLAFVCWGYFLHSFLCIYYTKMKTIALFCFLFFRIMRRMTVLIILCLVSKTVHKWFWKRRYCYFVSDTAIQQITRIYENWKLCCRLHWPVPLKLHCSKCFLCLILKGIYLPSSKWIILSLQAIGVSQHGKIPGLLIDSEHSFSC